MTEQHRASKRGLRRRRSPARAAALVVAFAVTATAMIGRVLLPNERTASPPAQPAALATESTDAPPSQDPAAQPPDEVKLPAPGSATPAVPSGSPTTVRISETGSGHFDVAPGTSEPVGSGDIVTYSVEIEDGLPFGARDIARDVERVLQDRRGWTAVMARSLQRVSAEPRFRIRLATSETADALCAPLDTDGRLSCRNGQMVVLNAWRWANGARSYGADLKDYRVYMVNHEFGHALGNSHAACPEVGRPAPVMVQQTKSLEGCTPNPWPTSG